MGLNDPIVNRNAKEITVIVLEKSPSGVYAACIRNEKERDWGQGKWNNSRDRKDLWKKVQNAVKNDGIHYGKEWTVKFRHRLTPERCTDLKTTKTGGEEIARKYDAEWFDWAKTNGYSPPARDEIIHNIPDNVEQEEMVFKTRDTPNDRSQIILPSIPLGDHPKPAISDHFKTGQR